MTALIPDEWNDYRMGEVKVVPGQRCNGDIHV